VEASYSVKHASPIDPKEVMDVQQLGSTDMRRSSASDVIVIKPQPLPAISVTKEHNRQEETIESLVMAKCVDSQTALSCMKEASTFESAPMTQCTVEEVPDHFETQEDDLLEAVPAARSEGQDVQGEVLHNAEKSMDQISPHQVDQMIQEQGQQLHELLQLFKQTTTMPLSSYVLQTPTHKTPNQTGPEPKDLSMEKKQRKSQRLKEKNDRGKPIIKMAQDLVAKKCGVIDEEKELDNMTLQSYIDMYKCPLSEDSMEAIKKLTEVASEKKKKKKSKQKEIKGQYEKKKDKKGLKPSSRGMLSWRPEAPACVALVVSCVSMLGLLILLSLCSLLWGLAVSKILVSFVVVRLLCWPVEPKYPWPFVCADCYLRICYPVYQNWKLVLLYLFTDSSLFQCPYG
jgi:hypothetical protein